MSKIDANISGSLLFSRINHTTKAATIAVHRGFTGRKKRAARLRLPEVGGTALGLRDGTSVLVRCYLRSRLPDATLRPEGLVDSALYLLTLAITRAERSESFVSAK